MSRIERLKEYVRPGSGWNGASRDQRNLDRWSQRASRNSDGDQHRAKSGGRIDLASTGRADLVDTGAPPRHDARVDNVMVAGDNYSSAYLNDDD